MAASFPTSQAIVVGGGLGGRGAMLSLGHSGGYETKKQSQGGMKPTCHHDIILLFCCTCFFSTISMTMILHLCPRPCQGMSAANTVVENGGRVVLLVESSEFTVNLSKNRQKSQIWGLIIMFPMIFVDGPLLFGVRSGPHFRTSDRELRTSRLFAVATAPRQPPASMEQAGFA